MTRREIISMAGLPALAFRLAGLLLVAVAVTPFAMAETAISDNAPTVFADELIYLGAQVKTQIEVNGEAAVALFGNMLDALVEQAEQQAQAVKQAGGKAPKGLEPMAMLPLVLPVIDSAKEAIKSLTQMTVLVMKPQEEVQGEQFLGYYNNLMGARGWSPLITVRDESKNNLAAMLGPEGKGLFCAISSPQELVVGMVTTNRPLGELLGQIASASGGALPAILKSVEQQESAKKALSQQQKSPAQKAPKLSSSKRHKK